MIETFPVTCGGGLAVELFEYPDSGKPAPKLWEGFPELNTFDSSVLPKAAGSESNEPVSEETGRPDFSADLQHSFEAGREQGIREGRRQEQEEQRAHLFELEQQRIARAVELTEQLAKERDRFLDSIEQEVVKLSLGIAERVLRREAQLDPLFLVGAVRVALGHLAENLHIRLRVPATDADLWIETLNHIPNLKAKPEVVSDPGMQCGECRIESEIGSADLSLSAQLGLMRSSLLRRSNPSAEPAAALSEAPL